jgi:hypothetical protein
MMLACMTKPAPESTASLWSTLWADYISALRNGHAAKARELKAQIARFDRDVLGL